MPAIETLIGFGSSFEPITSVPVGICALVDPGVYIDIDDGGDGLYIAPDLHDEYMAQTSLEMGALNGGL